MRLSFVPGDEQRLYPGGSGDPPLPSAARIGRTWAGTPSRSAAASGTGRRDAGAADPVPAKPRDVFFNTGAHLQAVWLNGKRIYRSEGWTGWHAGKERVAARLNAGRNTVVIETGEAFFLSVTDDNAW